MSLIICFITIFLYIIAVNCERADYCAQHPRNTPCVYDCKRSSKCGHTNTSYRSFSKELRRFIVNSNNVCRGIVAAGTNLTIRPPLLPEFKPLSYDKECEFIAGCYIKQCRNHPDKMRIALDGTHLGQNRFVLSVLRKKYTDEEQLEMREQVISAAIRTWFNPGYLLGGKRIKEIHDAYYPIIYPQRMATFTQMIWQETRYVGCAFMHSIRDKKYDMFELICNYRPRGNVIGEKVYDLLNYGTPCVREGILNDTAFQCINLSRDDSEDQYEPPINLDTAIGVHNLSMCYYFPWFCGLLFSILHF